MKVKRDKTVSFHQGSRMFDIEIIFLYHSMLEERDKKCFNVKVSYFLSYTLWTPKWDQSVKMDINQGLQVEKEIIYYFAISLNGVQISNKFTMMYLWT